MNLHAAGIAARLAAATAKPFATGVGSAIRIN
jgi:hypothetical protein